jgi:hypothetical protein
MTWNYRVCKSIYKEDGYEEVNYEIRETYYNPDGSIWAVSQNAAGVYSESFIGIDDMLEKMHQALLKPIIDLDDFIFAPQQPKEVIE